MTFKSRHQAMLPLSVKKRLACKLILHTWLPILYSVPLSGLTGNTGVLFCVFLGYRKLRCHCLISKSTPDAVVLIHRTAFPSQQCFSINILPPFKCLTFFSLAKEAPLLLFPYLSSCFHFFNSCYHFASKL